MAIKKKDENESTIDNDITELPINVAPTKKKILVTEFDDLNDSEDSGDSDDVTEKELENNEDQETVDELGVATDSKNGTQAEETAITDDGTEDSFDSVIEDTDNEAEEPIANDPTVGEAIDAATAADKRDTLAREEITDGTDSIDALVDDIVRTESTEQLAEADAKLAVAAAPVKKLGIKNKLTSGLRTWWHTAWLRSTTIGLLLLTIVLILLVPVTRYGVLNAIGVRVESSLIVIDSQTRLPLKNIQVQLQDKSAQTDKEGQVSFDDLKLGSSKLAISKRGYADNRRDITLGWGSNPIGEQEIVATGEQFTFILVDWLSNERLEDAEATAGESSANSDEDGKIVLTIAQEAIGEDEVVISADGYRDEIIQPEDLDSADIEVIMVPDRRHAFVSNRDGVFDVYVIDLDGKNEELIVKATEKEREVPEIVPHSTENKFALVSSRDGVENADKFILDGLFIVDAENGSLENIGRSERVQILGWSNDSLVYTQVVEGTSRGNAERSKLFSFNAQSGERTELASANYFNDIELVRDTVTFAVSSFAVPQSRAKLYAIKVDGSDAKEVLDKQVYTIFRTSQTKLLFNAVDQEWFTQVNDEDVVKVEPVLSPNNFNYSASPDGSKVAWSEIRDGKGVLFLSDRDGENEIELATIAGLDSVEYWANNETVIYRVISSEETADYVLNTNTPDDQRKISDVTASKRIFF